MSINSLYFGTNLSSSIYCNKKTIKKVAIGNTPIYSTDSSSDTGNFENVVYGYRINSTEPDSDKAVTYLEDAIGMTPAKMGESEFDYGSWRNVFFMPKPCMLKYDGTVDYYLDPNDYSKKIDGTPSDVSNADYPGNAMVEFPLIYYKMSTNANISDIYISNYKVDDDYNCWANINYKNEIVPHFYMSIYDSTKDSNGKMRSISGKNLTKQNGSGYHTFQEEIAMAELNNINDDKLWYTSVYCDYIIISLLLTLIGKSLNTQLVYGCGISEYSGVDVYNIISKYNTGSLNDKGMFWGL